MLDEHFMRDWNEVHEDFTTDLHATLTGLGHYQRDRTRGADPIDQTYQPPAADKLARLRLIVSCVVAAGITVALFAGALAILTAPRPALAATAGIVLV